jgi:hypothetical protein
LPTPGLLKRKAPNFRLVFHGWAGSRNPFTEMYGEIQGLYGEGDEAIFRADKAG